VAAVSSSSPLVVRAARPGEGEQIAALWRELWDAHDAWGGYAATSDARVYAQVAQRLEADARVRRGNPVLGRHVHLVAAGAERVAGQVEGWFERQGVLSTTPFTCEVRSLVVSSSERREGVGRALLVALGQQARSLARDAGVVLAAEVLDANPARTFYERLGYKAAAYSTQLDRAPEARASGFTARRADERDALAIALLEMALASRRRLQGDPRFDRPRAIDATMVASIAAHLAAAPARGETAELVSCDPTGAIRASAVFAVTALDPPFSPARRAMLGRFAFDPAVDPLESVTPLLVHAQRSATAGGASRVELTDLPAPGTALHDATVAAGARPWSRIYCIASPPSTPC